VTLVLCLSVARTSRADEANVCASAYVQAQDARNSGRLISAREALKVCAREGCPRFIVTDCTTWLPQVIAALPTIVVAPLDRDGHDLPGSVVAIDGVVTDATSGLEVTLDPGEHVVAVRWHGARAEQRVVLRTGEKARRVELRVDPEGTSSTNPARTPPPASLYIFGGATVVVGTVGGILWGVGSADARSFNAQCTSTGCSSQDRDHVKTELVVGDVVMSVAAAALVATAVVLVSWLSHAPKHATTEAAIRF
jgi:hypothetical protein